MMWGLPTTVEVGGQEHEIRTDFRVMLDIFEMLDDPDFDSYDRADGILEMFYVAPESIAPQYKQDAVNKFTWFQNGGDEREHPKTAKLVDWAQDYSMIVGAVNAAFQSDIRGIPYDAKNNVGGLHWWTFLAAYNNIGDSLFSHVVQLRDKKARHKPLTKEEREWYRRNREIVDIKGKYSAAEDAAISQWT